MSASTPVYINVRDRLRDLRALVDWLEQAGHERIVLLDNASTWPPLVDYMERTPHEVVRLHANLGSRALWDAELVPSVPFVYTDPDIVPIDSCPTDAVDHLLALLDRHPAYPKAGLGLYLDDVPRELPSLRWERSLTAPGRRVQPGVFSSLIDTTFAVYRGSVPFSYLSLRTGAPYEARHMSWYVTEPDDEDAYYLEHCIGGPTGSSWADSRMAAA